MNNYVIIEEHAMIMDINVLVIKKAIKEITAKSVVVDI